MGICTKKHLPRQKKAQRVISVIGHIHLGTPLGAHRHFISRHLQRGASILPLVDETLSRGWGGKWGIGNSFAFSHPPHGAMTPPPPKGIQNGTSNRKKNRGIKSICILNTHTHPWARLPGGRGRRRGSWWAPSRGPQRSPTHARSCLSTSMWPGIFCGRDSGADQIEGARVLHVGPGS